MTSERELQRSVLDWLKAKNITHWRVPLGGVLQAGGRFMTKNPMTGHPDIAGVLPKSSGRYFVIELKTDSGKLSDKQLYWITVLKNEGCLVIVARSLDDVKTQLIPLLSKEAS